MTESGASPSRNPLCPLCEAPTHPGEHVMFSNHEIVHVRCVTGTERLADVVTEFLDRHPERRFCHTCLAGGLHLSFEEARKATARLRMRRGVTIEVAKCSGCGALRVTLQARG